MHHEQVFEAGFVQRREWMLYKIREDHYPLNLTMEFEVTDFDPVHFQTGIDLMVKMHEVLRTTLRVAGGSLKQVIHDPDHFRVGYTFVDLRSMSPEEQETRISTKKLIQSALPFNFEFGPLFRISVYAKSDGKFELSLVFHHVVFDKYSAEIFKSDAIRVWQAVGEGSTGDWDPGRGQYKSYSAYENKLLNTRLGDSYHAYWKAQLVHGVPRLMIIDEDKWHCHYDHVVKKVKEVRSKMQRLDFRDERFVASVARRYVAGSSSVLTYVYTRRTSDQVAGFKKNSNSSLHALFIASFLVALHKLSGQQRFGFDIPASRKVDSEYKHIIGWLATGGVCFFDINENKGINAFLHYIDKQLYGLAKHCIYPFELLDHDAAVPSGSTMPVLFTLAETGESYAAGNPARGIVSHQRDGAATYQDLNIFLTVHDDACLAKLEYNNFLVAPEIIEQVMAGQESALNAIVTDFLALERCTEFV